MGATLLLEKTDGSDFTFTQDLTFTYVRRGKVFFFGAVIGIFISLNIITTISRQTLVPKVASGLEHNVFD